MNEKVKKLIPYTVLASVTISVYLFTLPYSFTYDDHHYIEESRYIKSWAALASIFNTGYAAVSPEDLDLTRPLMPVSLALDYSVWGLNPAGFRLTNILLHALNSVLVYILASSLLTNRWSCFLSALIFAVHPIHVEAVVGITFREDLLVTFFYLSALLLYIKSAEGSKFLYYLFSLAFFILALLSKEMAVTFPFVLLLCNYYILKREDGGKASRFLKISYWLPIPLYLLFLYSIYSKLPLPQSGSGGISGAIFPVLKMIATSAGLLLFPFNLHVDYDLHVALFDPGLLTGVIIILGAGWYLINGKNRGLSFCIAFFFVTLIPVMNIIPTFRLVADRFLYLPSVAFSLLAGIVIMHIGQRDRFRLVISAALILLLGVVAVKRGTVWENDLTLWSDVMKKSPGSVRAYAAVGAYYLKEGKDDEAMAMFQKTISLRPDYDKGYYNLGVLYLRKEYYDAAITSLSRAVELNPEYGKAYFQLGLAYANGGQYDKAVPAYEKAIKFMPDSAVLQNNLGNAYSANGDYSRAFAAYEMAISLDTNYADPHYNLGNLLVHLDNVERAIKAYKRAVELNPLNASAYYNLGNVYQATGKKDEAIYSYSQALNIDPSHKGASEALRQMAGDR